VVKLAQHGNGDGNGKVRKLTTKSSASYAEAALRDEAAQLADMAPETGRNDATNKAAHALARFVVEGTLHRAAIGSALYAVSGVNGLVSDTRVPSALAQSGAGQTAHLPDPAAEPTERRAAGSP
jgi:hypothetical protein